MRTRLIVWRCSEKKCGHEFYTQFYKKQALHRRLFGKAEKIKCPVCGQTSALRNRIVERDIVIEDKETLK